MGNNASYFIADHVMKMNILVLNINQYGQKDLYFKVRHKARARPLQASKRNRTYITKLINTKHDENEKNWNTWIRINYNY